MDFDWTLLGYPTFGLTLLLFHKVPGGDSSISYTVVGNYRTLFLTTYITSVLSAAFGLAKCLKTGVARIIQSKGPVDGYLSSRFILAFFGKSVKGIPLLISYS